MLLLTICTAMTSCWKENYPLSSDRYQVRNLSATADDASVALKWENPEQMTPESFIITYLDTESATVTLKKDGSEPQFTVTDLRNAYTYSFNVQAVYPGGKISGKATVSAKPLSRAPQGLRIADSGNQYLNLTWVKPEYSDLQGYTVSYTAKGGSAAKKEISADKTEYTLDGLVNDTEYDVALIANYPSGRSASSDVVKGTPSNIIPWTVSKTSVAAGEPVTFKYDQNMLPATNVTWDIPQLGKRTGDEITVGMVSDFNVQNNDSKVVVVTLSATIGSITKTWNINMTVRPFLFIKNDWNKGTNAYQGFKNDTPVFSPDGKTIYVMTFNNPAILYALDAMTGEQKWAFEPSTAAASYNGKTVNPVNGDIYFGNSTKGHFYCVKADGTLRWDNTGLGAFNQTSTPAVNKEGTVVYVHDAAKNVTALKASDGSKIWQVAMPAKGGGLLVNGDELVVGSCSSAGGVKFLKVSDGSEIASVDIPQNMSDGGGFAVSPDRKTAYLGTNLGSICAIDLVNHALIKTELTDQDNTNCNIWELAVSGAGDVFGGSKRGYMFCYSDKLESKKWVDLTMAGTGNAFNYAHPCCDAEGNFLITSGGSRNQNFKITSSGSVLKQWSSLNSDNQKQMSGNAFNNGVFYSGFLGGGSESGAFTAVYVGGELGSSGWPCHGGDICGSCCIK